MILRISSRVSASISLVFWDDMLGFVFGAAADYDPRQGATGTGHGCRRGALLSLLLDRVFPLQAVSPPCQAVSPLFEALGS